MCFLCFESNQSESLDFECSDLFLLFLEVIFVFVTQRKKKTLVEHCTQKKKKQIMKKKHLKTWYVSLLIHIQMKLLRKKYILSNSTNKKCLFSKG